MNQPIIIRFRWTADELLQADRNHFFHQCRPIFRLGLNILFGALLLGGVFIGTQSGTLDTRRLVLSNALFVIGVYWFVVRPFQIRWMIRWRFNKRPDRDIEVEWQVVGDTITIRSAIANSEMVWQAFTKVVFTPTGVMLYPNDQMFNWLPRHGFASAEEFDRFVEIAKNKIPKSYNLS